MFLSQLPTPHTPTPIPRKAPTTKKTLQPQNYTTKTREAELSYTEGSIAEHSFFEQLRTLCCASSDTEASTENLFEHLGGKNIAPVQQQQRP